MIYQMTFAIITVALVSGSVADRMRFSAFVWFCTLWLLFVYVPGIAHALGHQPLDPAQWLPILVTPIVLLAGEEARKAVVRSRASRRAATGSAR